MSTANSPFYLCRRIATSKDETQVTGPLWQRHQRVMQFGRNFHPGNQWYRSSLFHPMNGLQHTSRRYRYHHHSSRMLVTLNRDNRLSYGMPQDQFLQAHARAKFEDRRTQSTNRATRNLQHPGSPFIDAQFSMHRSFS